MAVGFNYGDVAELAALANSSPDQGAWWAWVKTKTSDADLIAIADELISEWGAAGTTTLAQIQRIGDSVQELQAALPTIRVSSHLETRDAVGEAEVEFLPAS